MLTATIQLLATMQERIFSTRDNQSVISALVTHRLEQGVAPSARDMQRLREVQEAVARRPKAPSKAAPPASCPMHQQDAPGPSRAPSQAGTSFAAVSGKGSAGPMGSGGGCPVPHEQRAKMAGNDELNPLNNMPMLSQTRLSAAQKASLSTERAVSSIPRSSMSAAPGASPYDAPAKASACPVPHDSKGKAKADEGQDSHWEYPSPQQFYNALVRKGWETPEENVEMMVLIHNFLNERAWQEVIEWEKLAGTDVSRLQLARFQGRPGTLSPKARVQGILAKVMPNSYSSEPPFDRHDWIVQRPVAPAGDAPSEDELKQGQVRYVIDYYEAPSEPGVDEAVFNLDVRPALDSLDAARLRARKAFQEWSQPEVAAQT